MGVTMMATKYYQLKLTVQVAISLAVMLGMLVPGVVTAQTLDELSYVSLPGNRIQLRLRFSESLRQEPRGFTIDNPARISVDFTGVSLNLKERVLNIGIGAVQKASVVEAGNRTRLTVNLLRKTPYRTETHGNVVLVLMGEQEDGGIGTDKGVAGMLPGRGIDDDDGIPRLTKVDFRRGTGGQGMVLVGLSSTHSQMNIEQRGLKLLVSFPGVSLPEELDRRLEVVDFATPVTEIDTRASANGVNMTITMGDDNYDYLAYQTDFDLTIEVQPLSRTEKELADKQRFKYTGERLSLNFQDIEVRAVLQLLAEFTGQNLIAGDTVGGRVTLRLNNVPWDQALDIILRNRGLGKRVEGNVLIVAPQEELAARERQELEAQQQIQDLEPLQTQYIQINYATAGDLAALIQDESASLLSERGTVTVDERTNILIVQDISGSLEDVRRLVERLDIPVEQVLIESRIVTVDDTFSKNLGVSFGYSRQTLLGENEILTLGGVKEGRVTRSIPVPSGPLQIQPVTDPTTGESLPPFVNQPTEDREICTGYACAVSQGTESYLVNLPVSSGALPGAAFGIALGEIGSWLLQLELEALLEEGRGERIASPKVITVNQGEAIIESGTQIPYQEASASGATSTSFIDAVLRLRVTPQITPDDRILLELEVNQDSPGETTSGGQLTVDTNRVSTNVLVDNGETVVLGGIFTHNLRDDKAKVPFFADLPYVGFLFRNSRFTNNKNELLIFVTPKILTSPSAG